MRQRDRATSAFRPARRRQLFELSAQRFSDARHVRVYQRPLEGLRCGLEARAAAEPAMSIEIAPRRPGVHLVG